jgi:hypothetical protein
MAGDEEGRPASSSVKALEATSPRSPSDKWLAVIVAVATLFGALVGGLVSVWGIDVQQNHEDARAEASAVTTATGAFVSEVNQVIEAAAQQPSTPQERLNLVKMSFEVDGRAEALLLHADDSEIIPTLRLQNDTDHTVNEIGASHSFSAHEYDVLYEDILKLEEAVNPEFVAPIPPIPSGG